MKASIHIFAGVQLAERSVPLLKGPENYFNCKGIG